MKLISTIASLLIGGAIGSGVTYYILDKKLKAKYEKQMTEELTKFKHDFKIDAYEKRLEEIDKETKELNKAREEESKKHAPDPRENPVIDTHKVDYTKKSDEKEEEDYMNNDFVEFIDTKPLEECRKEPYLITEEEHYSGPQYYDFDEYNYILPNEDVIDDNDEILEDVNKILGYKNLEALEDKKDGDYIYIRNEIYECDYCVTLIDWRNRK